MLAGFLRNALTRRGFERRGPWLTRFEINGRIYGGGLNYSADPLLDEFAARVAGGARVLELGSLEGGHSLPLAIRGYKVTAVEAREENLRRAKYVRRLLNVRHVKFVHADLERTPLTSFGRFDCVLCAGLLYHLPEPWRLIDELPSCAPATLIRTHYASSAEVEVNGLQGSWYTEGARDEPLAGLSPKSFWLTLPSMLGRLEQAGFRHVEIVGFPEHSSGPLVTIFASTRGDTTS
jgi:SAM-dependent methyltransferase